MNDVDKIKRNIIIFMILKKRRLSLPETGSV